MSGSGLPLLRVQGAALYQEPPGSGATARWWRIAPQGAGPAALQAARRDLGVLRRIGAEHPLGVAGVEEMDDGGLRVALPPAPFADQGLDALWSRGEPLPLAWVRALARGLCAEVASLHQQGIVHGGLCPPLVRVGAGPEPLAAGPHVLGAGWSSLWSHFTLDPDAPPEVVRYRPPELLMQARRRPDRQADLYAIGCLLVEAMTGRPAFEGADARRLREAILHGRRPDLLPLLGEEEEALDRVLSRCLSAEPSERHPSATALWRELAPALGAPADPLPTYHGVSPSTPASRPAPVSPSPDLSRGARPAASGATGFRRGAVALGGLLAALGVLVLVQAWRSRAPGIGDPGVASGAMASPQGTGSPSRGAASPSRLPTALRARGAADGRAPKASPLDPPPRVRVDPRTARLRGALGRVGLSEQEVVISSLLGLLFSRVAATLRGQDYRAFDKAMRPLELATRPRECGKIRRLKINYILGGIRALGSRLSAWERFRLERMLSDANAIRGPCPRRSALLRPIVLEVRSRLAYKHARGL